MISRRFWLLLCFVALGAAIASAHIIPGFNNSFVEAGIRDSLHLVGFACVAAIVFELVGGGLVKRSLAAIGAALLIGAASELAQELNGLKFDLNDLRRDVLGAFVMVSARALWVHSDGIGIGSLAQAAIRTSAVLITAVLLFPLLKWSWLYYSYVQRLPQLLHAADERDMSLIVPINAYLLPPDENGTVNIQIGQSDKSRVLVNFVATDWSGYSVLVMRVALQGLGQKSIQVELSDGPHPSFRLPHFVGTEPVYDELTDVRFILHNSRIVSGRPDLNFRNIEKMWFKGFHGGDSAILRLDKIWLE